ncbi:hypothetical protein N599_29610 [Saccharopolyspora erythraea D]|nr:hypothetical protein N599_29610 [Saccharopolyspora erythraea D]
MEPLSPQEATGGRPDAVVAGRWTADKTRKLFAAASS